MNGDRAGVVDEVQATPRNRILDVYAGFVRPDTGWLAISDLIELLAPVGVEDQATRSATSRMKRSKLLLAERVNGQAGYALSPWAQEVLQDGDRRIFREPGSWDGRWVIALFSVPETERSQRYQIRSRLEGLGYGQGPAGSWFAPVDVLEETRRVMKRNDLSPYVSLWAGKHEGFDPASQLVAEAWDLDLLRGRYDSYIKAAKRIADRWQDADPTSDSPSNSLADGKAAWIDYLDHMALWRALPYLDPGLPVELLPAGWPGPRARARFQAVESTLHPLAISYYRSATNG